MDFKHLSDLLDANCTCIAIDSPASDERFILEKIVSIANAMEYEVIYWTFGKAAKKVILCEGGIEYGKEELKRPQNAFTSQQELNQMLDWVLSSHDENFSRKIFIFSNVHKIVTDATGDLLVTSRVQSLSLDLETSPEIKRVIFLGQDIKIPSVGNGLIEYIKIPLPTVEEIKSEVEMAVTFVKSSYPDIAINLSDAQYYELVKSLQGLTNQEIVKNFRIAIRLFRSIGQDLIDFMRNRKIEKFERLGVKFSPPPDVAIAGMSAWQTWVEQNYHFFSEEAAAMGITPPKGVILVGIPGTGKSLAAKSVSKKWQMPVLSLNFGEVLSSYVGESETRFRNILEMAESVAPVVLLVDEIDKALAGVGAGALDSGVSDRIFGMFLSWLNDKTAPVFVIASANSITKLPPEFSRKGRFDEIFFVDLPNEEERQNIFQVHCQKRKLEVPETMFLDLVHRSQGFNGAEIAAVVGEVQRTCFLRYMQEQNCKETKLVPTLQEFIDAISAVTPLSVVYADEVAHMQKWGAQFARPASAPIAKAKSAPKKGNSRLRGINLN